MLVPGRNFLASSVGSQTHQFRISFLFSIFQENYYNLFVSETMLFHMIDKLHGSYRRYDCPKYPLFCAKIKGSSNFMLTTIS